MDWKETNKIYLEEKSIYAYNFIRIAYKYII